MAQYCARQGLRVLAIDLDHQGNFSSAIAQAKRACLAPVSSDQLLVAGGAKLPSERFVLAPAGDGLLGLERKPDIHNRIASDLRDLLVTVDDSSMAVSSTPIPTRTSG